ncbi:MAG: MerR family transcriptional regulator [Acidobacteriota bacterium]|nr:MerR family transcriptional regulator [Blastocatellia bacterium]MDW8238938.1 MerR family transcriptional regulator [Acidobacteriota bacterium]
MQRKQYPIRVVARRTGLTPHVIRMWEKRYSAVTPTRTATNRRLYSETDIERLLLLRHATEIGYSIGQVAQLSTQRLMTITAQAQAAAIVPAPDGSRSSGTNNAAQSQEANPQVHLEKCLQAIRQLDAAELDAALRRAAVSLSRPVLLEQLVSPLMQTVGDLWREGQLRIVHEHVASSVVRAFLASLDGAFQVAETAPTLIVTTPSGQWHEIGALLAACAAAADGWRVVYLGPSLPAEEIAGAVERHHAKAVALSIVYPGDDPRLGLELQKLRRYLPTHTILVGGRVADQYIEFLDAINAVRLGDLSAFRTALQALRSQQPTDS